MDKHEVEEVEAPQIREIGTMNSQVSYELQKIDRKDHFVCLNNYLLVNIFV